MKSKKIIISVLLGISILGVGCSKNSINNNPKNSVSQVGVFEIASSSKNNYEIESTQFEFGNESYISSSGKTLPYSIRGTMAAPKGEGKFPLVLITHGSHENLDESLRFDTGFEYLVKYLAENGYVAVSMDLSKAYIWKYGDNDDNEKSIPITTSHIESLKAANEGNNPGYNIDLTDKIDFDNVLLAGHSRGGEVVFDIANDQISKGQNIKGVLSIAPTASYDRTYGNYNVSILVPEYDGDVSSLDGYNIYSQIKKTDRNALTSITLLEKANHNYFNSNISRNDAEMLRDPKQLSDQLTREIQEKFLADFSLDFFNTAVTGNLENTMFDLNLPQANTMYGCDVKVQTINTKADELVNIKSSDEFYGEGATVEATQDSWFYKDDKVILDTLTYGNDELKIKPLINVKWQSSEDSVKITPIVTDFSNNSSLIFNLITDSADELNPKDVSQCFSVEIKDKSGNTAKAVLPQNLTVLEYTPGEIEITPLDDKNIEYWSFRTPVGGLKLPLSEFENIDFKNIDSVSLIFDQISSGSILIESIELQ